MFISIKGGIIRDEIIKKLIKGELKIKKFNK